MREGEREGEGGRKEEVREEEVSEGTRKKEGEGNEKANRRSKSQDSLSPSLVWEWPVKATPPAHLSPQHPIAPSLQCVPPDGTNAGSQSCRKGCHGWLAA